MTDKFIGQPCVCSRGVIGIPETVKDGIYYGHCVKHKWKKWQSNKPVLLSEHKPKIPEVWVIRHRTTGVVFVAPSGKSSWKAAGHAKNAWAQCSVIRAKELGVKPVPATWNKERMVFPRFDQQDEYECVKLSSDVSTSADVVETYSKLLTECIGKLTDTDLENRIKEFLNYDNKEKEKF